MRRVFPDKNLSSAYKMKRKLEELSGLEEEVYHCCINSCTMFSGPFEHRQACPICDEPRYDNRNHPRNVFRYLPLIPRLQALFKSRKMIQMLQYRQELGPYDGTLRDVFDSLHFRSLLEKDVSVNGVDYAHKIGELDTDLFIGFTFDGVSLWRGLGSQKARASTTCWPLAVVIYSLSPKLRTRLEYVFSLGIIPGPHSPKHVNSFLFPFFQECCKGAVGIPTYHAELEEMFDLRFWSIFNTMDMPGLAKADGGKGAGSIIPCHQCPINGVRNPDSTKGKTYYLPHHHPDAEESQTNDLLANPKTHKDFVEAWHELAEAETVAEHEAIQKARGITCIPILGLLPSTDLVRSFPFGLMHLLFENNAPNLVAHWKGNYKKLDPTDDPYALDEKTWKVIGKETASSVRTTPSWMARAMPDIWENSARYTAEAWAFWITWVAPYVMEGRLPDEHYRHLLLFSHIIKTATLLEIEEGTLEQLDMDVRLWHEQYEE
jgi:Transposase family tnp2